MSNWAAHDRAVEIAHERIGWKTKDSGAMSDPWRYSEHCDCNLCRMFRKGLKPQPELKRIVTDDEAEVAHQLAAEKIRVNYESGLPSDAAARKAVPIATGVLDYFPDAIAEVARVSKVGNDQHNPGQPLHWAKEKSSDEADALVRHLLERGKRDVDGMRHTAKVAWRALALLQRELDAER